MAEAGEEQAPKPVGPFLPGIGGNGGLGGAQRLGEAVENEQRVGHHAVRDRVGGV